MSPRVATSSRLRRLLAVIPWIVDHQGAPVSEIAARFGLTTRELEADLELIPFCGLPPYSPDRLIDCQVVDDRVFLRFAEYFARPVSLTPAEGFALLAAGRALLEVPGSDPQGSLAGALDKLAGVLGGPGGVAVQLGSGPFLEVLREAARSHQRVEIDYYTFGRDVRTTRLIDPHAVFASEGQWYVDAYCHSAGDDRLFRVDRVGAARMTDQGFTPVEGRPIPTGVFRPGAGAPRVTLLLAEEARWVLETYPTEGSQDTLDGRVRVALVAAGHAWLERLLLRLGAGAEVVDPPELTTAGADAARRVLERYR
ncbi:MAG: helix-turn-helix transcriptional regulator [Acidimicrobiia bacterium]